MASKLINLTELESHPQEIREAVAFYAARSVLPVQFTTEEREQHYSVLEKAGFIEPITAVNP